ncbi:MAG: hypothetical protein AAB320_01100 [Elusimicrobiota bacterium]
MKRNFWLTLAILAPISAHAAAFSPVTLVAPRMFPILPTPIVSIRPNIALPSPINPLAPLSPSVLLAPTLSASALPSAPALVPAIEITPVTEEKKIILPGSFNPGSPIKMPLVNDQNVSKVAARLNAVFDGTSQPERAPVAAPSQQVREDESASGEHLTLPEMDLENEIGIGQALE